MSKILILGAGHAGGTAAALLRQYGFEGQIILAGAEPVAPYQRPPLSKAWLKGEADLEAVMLRPDSFYDEQTIDLRRGHMAVAIDRAGKRVRFADGSEESYDTLVLALGSRARRLALPGAERSDPLELRTLHDAERLKAALTPGQRLVVVGGGYVGLEAAASARALGCEVVVLEREARLLARVASEPLSTLMAQVHRDHGVDIRLGAQVMGFEDAGVRLADDTVIGGDAVLVGVGGVAEMELAAAAGLACEQGVVVDQQARTSDPDIYAIGDMTWRPLPLYGDRRGRLESVPNALEQAKQVASALTGRPDPAPEVPWFWSDQYDLKLQIAGLPLGADRIVTRGIGEPGHGPFAVFHLAGDRIACVEAVNAPAEFMGGRLMIGKGQAVDVDKLADPAVPMKQVAAG